MILSQKIKTKTTQKVSHVQRAHKLPLAYDDIIINPVGIRGFEQVTSTDPSKPQSPTSQMAG
jgi:hypothetical protein